MNTSVRNWNDETMELAEQFQKDCHEIVEKVMAEDSNVSYADATMVFVFNKLAELQIKLQKTNHIE